MQNRLTGEMKIIRLTQPAPPDRANISLWQETLDPESLISPESVSNITDALLKPELLTTVSCPQDDSPCDIHLNPSPSYILKLPNFDSDIHLSDAILSTDLQLFALPLPLSVTPEASEEVKPPPDYFNDWLPKELRIDILRPSWLQEYPMESLHDLWNILSGRANTCIPAVPGDMWKDIRRNGRCI